MHHHDLLAEKYRGILTRKGGYVKYISARPDDQMVAFHHYLHGKGISCASGPGRKKIQDFRDLSDIQK